jgi:hypothetical protein
MVVRPFRKEAGGGVYVKTPDAAFKEKYVE